MNIKLNFLKFQSKLNDVFGNINHSVLRIEKETDEQMFFELSYSGVPDANSFHITISDDFLQICVDKSQKENQYKKYWSHKKMRVLFDFSGYDDIDYSSMQVNFVNSILTISFNKIKKEKFRKRVKI